MIDVQKCWECGFSHHIDAGESCNVCSARFCIDCSLEQGFLFHDIFGGSIYVCIGCIAQYKEKGIDWLRGELCEEFEEAVFLKALKEFEAKESRLNAGEQDHELSDSDRMGLLFSKMSENPVILDPILKRGKRLAGAYASKYICDRLNRDVSKITDDDLQNCFSGCVMQPKVEWYPFIREEIAKIIIEATGEPIGAERQ